MLHFLIRTLSKDNLEKLVRVKTIQMPPAVVTGVWRGRVQCGKPRVSISVTHEAVCPTVDLRCKTAHVRKC